MSEHSRNKIYSQDGVDVEEEALFSKFAGSVCKASYNNSPFVEVHDMSGGNFRGPRPFTLKNLPEGFFIEATADGIGTKGPLIDAAKNHEFAAYDIVAMVASDITRYGGVPLILINTLDVVSVGEEGDEINKAYKQTVIGLGEVAKQARLVLLKGETAQMGICLGSDDADSKTKINWSATAIGAYHKNKMITGENLSEGQVIIALKENGFRCNGMSAVRASLKAKYGEWWKNPEAAKDVKAAATPSVLYDNFLNTLNGWFNQNFKAEINIHAIVHLSGGAIKEKLAKDLLFPKGLSADLNNLWEPPEIMKKCAEWRNFSDEEFYEAWNGGQGMLVIIDKKDCDHFINKANDFKIEAKIAGQIIKTEHPRILIHSQLNKGKEIIYNG